MDRGSRERIGYAGGTARATTTSAAFSEVGQAVPARPTSLRAILLQLPGGLPHQVRHGAPQASGANRVRIRLAELRHEFRPMLRLAAPLAASLSNTYSTGTGSAHTMVLTSAA